MRLASLALTAILSLTLQSHPVFAGSKTAIFAGGCFWCMEKDYEHVEGVIDVQSGYAGGTTSSPTYKNYESGNHIEVVKITFDDAMVTYGQLLHTFWRSVNPTDAGGQFCDRGRAYSTAIFALDENQRQAAEVSKAATNASGKLKNPIVTPILDAATFYPAEDYHQDFYKKNSLKYSFYRKSCGRDRSIRALWGKEAHAGINY